MSETHVPLEDVADSQLELDNRIVAPASRLCCDQCGVRFRMEWRGPVGVYVALWERSGLRGPVPPRVRKGGFSLVPRSNGQAAAAGKVTV